MHRFSQTSKIWNNNMLLAERNTSRVQCMRHLALHLFWTIEYEKLYIPVLDISVRLPNNKTIVCSVKLELSRLFWDAWHIVVIICLVSCVGTLDSSSGLYILLCFLSREATGCGIYAEYNCCGRMSPFLAYFSYFEEIKGGLWDHHAVCCPPSQL
jgi:hypothetical protein